MNQLTTIASLPSGAGQAAHLKPEVGRAKEQPTYRYEILPNTDSLRDMQTGYILSGLVFASLPSAMQAAIRAQVKPITLEWPEIEG